MEKYKLLVMLQSIVAHAKANDIEAVNNALEFTVAELKADLERRDKDTDSMEGAYRLYRESELYEQRIKREEGL